MIEWKMTKSAGGISGLELTPEDLASINRLTLRELSLEEVFAFRVTLCDNLVDRDGERFTARALVKLAELFQGCTGIFDHRPTAQGQTARIFQTGVEQETDKKAPGGEAYTKLAAKAYMLRDEATMPTIRAIEAGILKEVSVSCSMGRITCSVCGKDRRNNPCKHRKGEEYGGAACHYRLEEPTDAFEWSFVAVPAQPGAGVTKAGEPGIAEVLAELGVIRGLVEGLAESPADKSTTPDEDEAGGENPDSPLPEEDPETAKTLRRAAEVLADTERRMRI